MGNILPIISMVTGLAGGTLAMIVAHQKPEQARQMRTFGFAAFGMAGLMLLLLVL